MSKLHDSWRVTKGGPMLGADPELFVRKDGAIVGSEAVIPPHGIYNGRIVRDGVQIELHPLPAVCRATVANSIGSIFVELDNHLRKAAGHTLDFTPVLELNEAEMKALSPEARVLGCQPSSNIHDPSSTVNVPAGYPIRSAGGHIHIGLFQGDHNFPAGGYAWLSGPEQAKRIIQAMDFLVGNTCVLIDRDPKQAVRRETYGRAGEYRLPDYGVEYRTLSNFWLQAHELWSLVGGLTKLVIGLFDAEHYGTYCKSGKKDSWGYDTYHYDMSFQPYEELLKRCSPEEARQAINENDLKKAWSVWDGVKDWLQSYTVKQDGGLDSTRVEAFEFFARRIQEQAEKTGGNGLSYWFPTAPLSSWLGMGDQHNKGWETFIDHQVTKAMRSAKEQADGVIRPATDQINATLATNVA